MVLAFQASESGSIPEARSKHEAVMKRRTFITGTLAATAAAVGAIKGLLPRSKEWTNQYHEPMRMAIVQPPRHGKNMAAISQAVWLAAVARKDTTFVHRDGQFRVTADNAPDDWYIGGGAEFHDYMEAYRYAKAGVPRAVRYENTPVYFVPVGDRKAA